MQPQTCKPALRRLDDLGERDVSYDHAYRAQISRDILAKCEVTQSVFFDDIVNTVNRSQQGEIHGALGYVRCALPAAELAVVRPANVVSMMPPLPEEILFAERFVEAAGGARENLTFWLYIPSEGRLIDLSAVLRGEGGEERYRDLIRSCAANPPSAEYADHFQAVRALVRTISEAGRILVLPHQTRELHYEAFRAELDEGLVVLPSPSDRFVDKYSAAETLRAADGGLENVLLNPIRVQVDPAIPRTERIAKIAEAIIEAAIAIEQRVGAAYIKLDGSGVSGVDNLSPNRHHGVYEGARESRIAALREHMEGRFGKEHEIPTAVIEERVQRVHDRFGVREYVASGVTTGAGFERWCIVRAINNRDDVFQGVIGSTECSKVGITADDIEEISLAMSQVGAAMNTAGYEFGYIAKDLMFDARTNSMKINDHNDRRGGRSFLERILTLAPGEVFMDKDYEFKVPGDASHVEYGMRIVSAAAELGHQVYGSCTMFYPIKDVEGLKIKLKIVSVVPSDILETSGNIIFDTAARVQRAIEERVSVQNHH